MMQNYVVGFLFNKEGSEVLLMRKNRPSWQKGYLNGIGGSIEEGETIHGAMIREFFEETGIEINSWRRFAVIETPKTTIDFFATTSDKTIQYCSNTDEEVVIRCLPLSDDDIIKDLYWLVLLAKYVLFVDSSYQVVNIQSNYISA